MLATAHLHHENNSKPPTTQPTAAQHAKAIPKIAPYYETPNSKAMPFHPSTEDDAEEEFFIEDQQEEYVYECSCQKVKKKSARPYEVCNDESEEESPSAEEKVSELLQSGLNKKSKYEDIEYSDFVDIEELFDIPSIVSHELTDGNIIALIQPGARPIPVLYTLIPDLAFFGGFYVITFQPRSIFQYNNVLGIPPLDFYHPVFIIDEDYDDRPIFDGGLYGEYVPSYFYKEPVRVAPSGAVKINIKTSKDQPKAKPYPQTPFVPQPSHPKFKKEPVVYPEKVQKPVMIQHPAPKPNSVPYQKFPTKQKEHEKPQFVLEKDLFGNPQAYEPKPHPALHQNIPTIQEKPPPKKYETPKFAQEKELVINPQVHSKHEPKRNPAQNQNHQKFPAQQVKPPHKEYGTPKFSQRKDLEQSPQPQSPKKNHHQGNTQKNDKIVNIPAVHAGHHRGAGKWVFHPPKEDNNEDVYTKDSIGHKSKGKGGGKWVFNPHKEEINKGDIHDHRNHGQGSVKHPGHHPQPHKNQEQGSIQHQGHPQPHETHKNYGKGSGKHEHGQIIPQEEHKHGKGLIQHQHGQIQPHEAHNNHGQGAGKHHQAQIQPHDNHGHESEKHQQGKTRPHEVQNNHEHGSKNNHQEKAKPHDHHHLHNHGQGSGKHQEEQIKLHDVHNNHGHGSGKHEQGHINSQDNNKNEGNASKQHQSAHGRGHAHAQGLQDHGKEGTMKYQDQSDGKQRGERRSSKGNGGHGGLSQGKGSSAQGQGAFAQGQGAFSQGQDSYYEEPLEVIKATGGTWTWQSEDEEEVTTPKPKKGHWKFVPGKVEEIKNDGSRGTKGGWNWVSDDVRDGKGSHGGQGGGSTGGFSGGGGFGGQSGGSWSWSSGGEFQDDGQFGFNGQSNGFGLGDALNGGIKYSWSWSSDDSGESLDESSE